VAIPVRRILNNADRLLIQIGNCSVNAFPSLFLAGSSETNLTGKGAFQELDAVSFLTPHTKLAVRPSSKEPYAIADAIHRAYHTCWAGRPGPTFVDLPADLIMDEVSQLPNKLISAPMQQPVKPYPDPRIVSEVVELLKGCSSPLVIIGKGAAYARAEASINSFVSSTNIPFLPTPMGKGVIPDDSKLNASSARSTALKQADVILLLGARLNWILHFGEPPKFRSNVKLVQVDVSAEELGRSNGLGEPNLGLVSDIGAFVEELHKQLDGWKAFHSGPSLDSNSLLSRISEAASKNEKAAEGKAVAPTKPGSPLTYQRAFHIVKETLHQLSPPEEGNVVYVSEGANTMDISRSAFPLHHPRQRLDAGTYATMGVGMGYSIAAYAAYNMPQGQARQGRSKKIVAIEGDSALGFSAMEIETMQRQQMPILIFIMNNSGVYHGDSASAEEWELLQKQTTANEAGLDKSGKKKGLRSTSLWYETRYEKLAEMVGGRGFFVRSEEELEHATRESYREEERVCVVNVIVEPGLGKTIGFAWQQQAKKGCGNSLEAMQSKL
jgi:2-hydroxyacyl-CoA lyase 1